MSGINKITTALTVAGMMAFPGVSEAQKLTKQTTEEAITALAGEVKKVPDSTTVNFAKVEKGGKYGNYADEMGDNPTYQAIAIKWVEEGKKGIPEGERAKFEKVAWEVIKDIEEQTMLGVSNIAERNGCIQWEEALAMVGNEYYDETEQITQELEKNIKDIEKDIKDIEKDIKDIEKDIKDIENATLEKIKAFENKLIAYLKGKDVVWIKENFGKDLEKFFQQTKDNNYQCKPEMIALFTKLGLNDNGTLSSIK